MKYIFFISTIILSDISFVLSGVFNERKAITNHPYHMIEAHNMHICSHIGLCGEPANYLRSEMSLPTKGNIEHKLICVCKK
jgi:hypothetical protein